MTLNSLILSARELVDEFYSRLGQRPSKIKREKSIEECLNLLLDGFTVEEVDYAITWLIQHHPTTGSFSRLSHFIDQAIKEWEAGQQTREVDQEEARAAEHQGAEQQRMEDERQQIEEAKGLLPPETLEGLYHEAKHLIEQESPGLKFGKDLMIRVNLNCDGDHGGAPVAIRVVMATTQHGHIPSDVSGQDPSAERKWHETKGCGCKA